MLPRTTRYYTLIASLPPMPSDLEQAKLPINRLRLESRLAMLSPQDRRTINKMERFLEWERRPRCCTDQEVMKAFDRILAKMEYPLAREIVSNLMDIRILVAAVRRRHRDLPPPEPFGSWGHHIVRNWQRADFGLGVRFPWLNQLRIELSQNKVMASHRLVIAVIWDYLSNLAEQHYFDFEAVIIYLTRWDVLNNWVKQDREKGRNRFNKLTREVMGRNAEIFN